MKPSNKSSWNEKIFSNPSQKVGPRKRPPKISNTSHSQKKKEEKILRRNLSKIRRNGFKKRKNLFSKKSGKRNSRFRRDFWSIKNLNSFHNCKNKFPKAKSKKEHS